MVKLLDTKDNAINITTTTQMVTVDMLLGQAKKEAAAAAAAAKKVAKLLGTDVVKVKTAAMTREEANREADKQNIANQTIDPYRLPGPKAIVVGIDASRVGLGIFTFYSREDGTREDATYSSAWDVLHLQKSKLKI
jgi:hypothetical protein